MGDGASDDRIRPERYRGATFNTPLADGRPLGRASHGVAQPNKVTCRWHSRHIGHEVSIADTCGGVRGGYSEKAHKKSSASNGVVQHQVTLHALH